MQKKQNTTDNTNLISWVLLIILAIIWGMSFILVKKVLVVFTPVQVGAFRIFSAGLVFLPIILPKIKEYPFGKTKWFLLSGLSGYLIPALLFAYAGTKISSSLSGTLNTTTPLFVLLVGVAFFGHRVRKNQIFGLILGFIGSLILVLVNGKGNIGFNNPYALLVVLATILYAINAHITQKYLTDLKAIMMSGYTLMFVGGIAFVILCFTDFWTRATQPENQQELILGFLLGAINSGLAAVGFNYILKLSGVTFASSVTYLIPIVALMVGILDGESVFIYQYLGMGIILLGVYLVNRKSN